MATIGKLLVANRGEIARRIMRTAREMSIGTVVVCSDPDADAPFVREADEVVRLLGSSPADTYLRSDLIVAAALRTGADAVHPGYGFLSENGDFARACLAAGLTFVGPPPAAIDAMGSKIEAKELMARAGVPVLPGLNNVDATGPDSGGAILAAVGLPLIVKAAFGGGGRGMRVVRDAADLPDALRSAAREAAAAFGDGTVFVERYVEDPRHVEVQIIADEHGAVSHLFERECSIQRRHQKVVEEAPSPVVNEDLRRRIGADAVRAAEAIGYVGAGTVEFVLDRRGTYAFLEVNTRLQVEHPVTEMITGLDLVRLQLEIAEGAALPPAVIDARIDGHAIEVRLYAEDAAADFRPTSGALHRLRIPSRDGLRVDAGYDDGSTVSTFYDAMLAKVIAWAPDRRTAAESLADALARAEIHGVTTNRDLLVATLRHPAFLTGDTDTGFFTRHEPAALIGGLTDRSALPAHAAAVVAASRVSRNGAPPTPAGIPSGWRNVGTAQQPVRLTGDGVDVTVRLEGDHAEVTPQDAEPIDVIIVASAADVVDVTIDGVGRRVRVHACDSTWFADSAAGHHGLAIAPRHPDPASTAAPGSLLAPMPGSVVAVHVAAGDPVDTGTAIVTIEAMKMQHTVSAPTSGTVVDLAVVLGQQVTRGDVLAVVEAD